MTDCEWTAKVDAPLRVVRDVSKGNFPHCLLLGPNVMLYMLDDQQADDIEAQLAAPDLPPHVAAALADGLPEGVRVGLVADGQDIPEGWGWRYDERGWHSWGYSGASDDCTYEVRPPAPPAPPQTERVPWWEAVGRRVSDRLTIVAVGMDQAGPWWESQSGVRTHTIKMHADGTVEVLALPEGERS